MKITENVVLCDRCNSLIEFGEQDVESKLFFGHMKIIYNKYSGVISKSKEKIAIKFKDWIKCRCENRIELAGRERLPGLDDFVKKLRELLSEGGSDDDVAMVLYCLTDREFDSEPVQDILDGLHISSKSRIRDRLEVYHKVYRRPDRYYDRITNKPCNP